MFFPIVFGAELIKIAYSTNPFLFAPPMHANEGTELASTIQTFEDIGREGASANLVLQDGLQAIPGSLFAQIQILERSIQFVSMLLDGAHHQCYEFFGTFSIPWYIFSDIRGVTRGCEE